MKQNYGFLPLETHISKILKPVFAKKKDNFLVIGNLNKNWQKIVGEKCWRFCSVKKIKFAKNKKSDAIVTIAASNSAIAFYIEANSSQIIENIASYYGYKIVSQIKIVQEPSDLMEEPIVIAKKISQEQQDFIAKSTSIVKNEELKLVLQQLGKSIL
jgi:hypothetical protein